jgi:hypothetical protein
MGNITRDSQEMRKFAEYVQEYSNEFRRSCQSLLDNMDAAMPFLNDKTAKDGTFKTYVAVSALKKSLPVIEEAGRRLQKSAEKLEGVLDIKF